MGRMIQVFNPVHNQKVTDSRLNIMGRCLERSAREVALYLDRRLLRRVRTSPSGGFEYRLDLSSAEKGEHEIEIRVMAGRKTERLMVPFRLVSAETPEAATEGDSGDA